MQKLELRENGLFAVQEQNIDGKLDPQISIKTMEEDIAQLKLNIEAVKKYEAKQNVNPKAPLTK